MAKNQLDICCYQGVKHEGNPRGRIEKAGEIEAYVTEPSAGVKSNGYGILYLTDIIGHKFTNAQLVADQFADNGYVVVVPDLFYGDPVPLNAEMENFNLPAWMKGEFGQKRIPHIPATVDPVLKAGLDLLREKYHSKKIAVTGYCFGAKYAVRLCGGDDVAAAFIAHPAMIEPQELDLVKRPVALAAAETDNIFPITQRHYFEAKLKDLGHPYQINVYSGVKHGFAVRCDLSRRVEQFAKESAFFQALQWFEEHLSDD